MVLGQMWGRRSRWAATCGGLCVGLVCVGLTGCGGSSAGSAGDAGTAQAQSAVLGLTVPAVPSGLQATPGNAEVTLSWTASTGAVNYIVARGTSSAGPFTSVGTVAAPTYVDPGLTNGDAVYFVVSAVNAAGASANSTSVAATPTASAVATTAPATTPPTPTTPAAPTTTTTPSTTTTTTPSPTTPTPTTTTSSSTPSTTTTTSSTAPTTSTSTTSTTTTTSTTAPVAPVAPAATTSAKPAAVASGNYLVLNLGSGLAVAGSASPATPQQAAPAPGNAQLWAVAPTSGGAFSVVNALAGLALSAPSGASAGTAVTLASAAGGTSQSWVFTLLSNGLYRIAPASNPALALDIAGQSTTTGAGLQLSAASTASSQQFQLMPASSSAATVVVNTAVAGTAVTDQILGMNMSTWYDPGNSANAPALSGAGIKALRLPGGSNADLYHWQGNLLCVPNGTSALGVNPWLPTNVPFVASNGSGGYKAGPLVGTLIAPSGTALFDVAVTVDYGTNATCDGPGDPAEAAAWVAAAKASGNYVSHWTVGNEVYGGWEVDLHAVKNDPTTYANAVAGTGGYYPLMKAANPSTMVGVVVLPACSAYPYSSGPIASCATSGQYASTWDQIVLSGAKYDFVEYHYYAQAPGSENDATLLARGAKGLTIGVNAIRAELAAAGHPNTPIYVGELGSVYGQPGAQSTSITQALFAGQVLGELMNDGVSRATWWLGLGGCTYPGDGGGENWSTSLYNASPSLFGGYMTFADSPALDGYACVPAGAAPGAMLPTARAFQLFSTVAQAGEHVLSASVLGDAADVQAYSATHGAGTALVVFNTNQTQSESVTIGLSGRTTASAVTVQTYDKALYDASASTNNWTLPTTTRTLGAQSLPLTLTLTPWSMNVVTITN